MDGSAHVVDETPTWHTFEDNSGVQQWQSLPTSAHPLKWLSWIIVARVTAWNNDQLHIYEPGFDVVVKQCRGKNLFFSTDVENHIFEADIIFVSVNTPTKTQGLCAKKTADLMYWESAARMIADVSKSDKIVVEKSTFPVKTVEAIERILTHNSKGINYQILSNPEFLVEGTAIRDLFGPDRILIGGKETTERQKAIQALMGASRKHNKSTTKSSVE
ncbi:UDP-glucose 6-dehydrogenase 3 [Forsythia ovata]|uniref:UDP-glucose 6-dehydrogenase 3 n=1 Tax=Forsythia ovata TaxID=205694 RepID=A0ABD1WJH7_9LAMI